MSSKKNTNFIPGRKPGMPQKFAKPGMPQAGAKPAMPVVNNEKLEKLLDEYKTDNSMEKLAELIEALRSAQVFTAAKINEDKKVNLGLIKTKEGKSFAAIYTSKDQIPKVQEGLNIILLPYPSMNQMLNAIFKTEAIEAMVINPQKQNFVVLPKMIEKIEEAEQKSKAEGKHVAVDLTLPVDPSKPQIPELHNENIDAKCLELKNAVEQKDKNRLILELLTMLRSQKLVVALGTDANGGNAIELFTHKDSGEKRLPVFTHPKLSFRGEQEKKLAVMEFDKAVDILSKMAADVKGISIVSKDAIINIERPFLENYVKNNGNAAVGSQNMNPVLANLFAKLQKGEELTEKETALLEHTKFEVQYLPRALKEGGQAFIDELCSRKAAFVDELFEKSYFNIRMYPYLEEEFSVIAIHSGDDQDAIRIDFPARDQGPGTVPRAYIIWNSAEKQGRYFAIGGDSVKGRFIMEYTDEKPIVHGPAPVENAEVQAVLDIVNTVKV